MGSDNEGEVGHRSRDRDRDRKDRDRDRDRDSDRHRHKSSRDHKSSRRRSRSKERKRRSRSRSRSRERPRERKTQFDSGPSAALMAQQQQAHQQAVLAQQLLLQQQMMAAQGAQAAGASNKKQREVYFGNLTVGMVTPQMLTELCNGALAPLCPDAATSPPVMGVTMDSEGKFAFVEMRTEELATAALHLDKVELCGRSINVGRPKGYIDPALGPPPPNPLVNQFPNQGLVNTLPNMQPNMLTNTLPNMQPNMLNMLPNMQPNALMNKMMTGGMLPGANPAAALLGMGGASPATKCLYLENMVSANDLLDPEERADIAEDVKEECSKKGEVVGVAVPCPPQEALDKGDAGRVYVLFKEQAGAIAAQRSLNGRTFSGNKVIAAFVPEEEFEKAEKGEWLAPPPAPTPLEGVIKMRGLPFTATKQDIVLFFQGFGLQESGVHIVVGMDGRPTGETYAVFEGPNSDIRGALSKDRMMLGNRYVELFLSSKDEIERRKMSGTLMI